MTPTVYVAGRNLAAIAQVGGLVISHEWPVAGVGGPVSAQFELLMPRSRWPGWLAKDARAVVRLGGWPLLAGTLAEPDWEDQNVTIEAAAREGGTAVCLTAAGLTTSTPNVALDAAIARGALSWTRPASISTTALTTGDETATLNSISDMLTAYAEETGERLYVNATRQLLKRTDPTVPELVVLPGSGELAWTTESQATRLVGRWANTAGALSTAIVGAGALERKIDLTPRGPLTAPRATAILTQILADASAGGWTNGLTVTSSQIIGSPHLADVADRVGRGLMVRLLGQRDPRPDRPPVGYVDFIPERSEWHVADAELVLTPRGMVARDFAAILAEAGVEEVA